VLNPFKKFRHSAEAAETYLRTSQLLLQAIGLHAVEAEPQEYQSFRVTIEALESKLNKEVPLAEGLLAVGAAAEAMHDYGLRTTRFIKAQNSGWQALARVLTEAIGDLDPKASHAVELREINWKIGKASTVEDIRDLKRLVAECLEGIRNEITGARVKEKSSPAAVAVAVVEPALLTEMPVASAAAANPLPRPDFSTELPVRCDAETAIRESRQNGDRSFAVLFVIDRLRHIYSRFGKPVGDKVRALFLKRLAGMLLPDDRLFTWGESSVVALLKQRDSENEARQQVERTLFRRLVETFTVRDQSVMLPISATWVIVPVAESGYDAIADRLDSFVTQNMH
jgi:GGDEF domain-containing protein